MNSIKNLEKRMQIKISFITSLKDNKQIQANRQP